MYRNIAGSLPKSFATYQADHTTESTAGIAAVAAIARTGASAAAMAVPQAPAFDDVMRLVYSLPPRPTLHKDLWGEIAKFASRDALLNLRATHAHMAAWVDREITSLRVNATDAPAMLTALAGARHLKHIDSLRIANCTDDNFPPAMAALAALNHTRVDLVIEESRNANTRLTATGLLSLRNISPHSLEFWCGERFSRMEAEALAPLSYPISVQGVLLADVPRDQIALARIPQLTKLSIWPHWVDGEGVRALAAHPILSELRILSSGQLSISDDAVVSLAGSTSIRSLCIGSTRNAIGARAFLALVENSTLESLKIGNTVRPVDPAFVEILSANSTLRSLDIPVSNGCGHLAKMASLKDLTVRCTSLNMADANMFLRNAHLNRLAFVFFPDFDPGTFSIVASSDIASLSVARVALSAQDIHALLENRSLRSLDLALTSDFAETVGHVIALAGHPTLTMLTINYVKKLYEEPQVDMSMTQQERGAMMAAWGNHRRPDALMVNF